MGIKLTHDSPLKILLMHINMEMRNVCENQSQIYYIECDKNTILVMDKYIYKAALKRESKYYF